MESEQSSGVLSLFMFRIGGSVMISESSKQIAVKVEVRRRAVISGGE
jgi:hypothetical protein